MWDNAIAKFEKGKIEIDPHINDKNDLRRGITLLLKPDGKFIATFPFGQPYEDKFIRSFTFEDIDELFHDLELKLIENQYFYRESHRYWRNCSLEIAKTTSNSKKDRGRTGVNCIGCFLWKKK